MRKTLRKTAKAPLWVWLILFIASSLICLFALRHNNQQMVKLRSAVYSADQKGSSVNKALNNLRSYVYAHMNTSLSSGGNNIKPPIQLKYTYQRLYDAQAAELQAQNQKVYSAAQAYCRSIGQTSWGLGTIGCIQNYVVNHGVKNASINIPPGLYEFDFISPLWSPDLAGWSLLASILLLIILMVKAVHLRLSANKK